MPMKSFTPLTLPRPSFSPDRGHDSSRLIELVGAATYLAKTVREGAFGKHRHNRQSTPIDRQTSVRMNRDTLYSDGVFDLDATPVTITAGKQQGRPRPPCRQFPGTVYSCP